MSDDRRETISIEEATISNMWDNGKSHILQ
jgi:hypothetical protein